MKRLQAQQQRYGVKSTYTSAVRLVLGGCLLLAGTGCGQFIVQAREPTAAEPTPTMAPIMLTTATPMESDSTVTPPPINMPDGTGTSTPAERKIDSNLLYVIRLQRGEIQTPSPLAPDIAVGPDGTIDIEITAQIQDAYLAQLKTLGLDITEASSEHSQIRARAQYDRILEVAALAETQFIRAWQAPMTNPQH